VTATATAALLLSRCPGVSVADARAWWAGAASSVMAHCAAEGERCDTAAVGAFVHAAGVAGVRAVPLVRGAAPAVARWWRSPAFAALPPLSRLQQLHSGCEAVIAQVSPHSALRDAAVGAFDACVGDTAPRLAACRVLSPTFAHLPHDWSCRLIMFTASLRRVGAAARATAPFAI